MTIQVHGIIGWPDSHVQLTAVFEHTDAEKLKLYDYCNHVNDDIMNE